MTDTELRQTQPTLCQRICCCFSSTSKEPPVQLIRSETLHASTPKTNGQHISAAEASIDGFEDVNLDVRTTVANSSPKASRVKKDDLNDINMTDIMMEEVFREEKPEDVECVIEDAVSISTDVIQEVDETELSRLRLRPSMDTPPPEEKVKELVYDPEKSSHNNDDADARLSEERPSNLAYPEKPSRTDNDVDGRLSEELPSTSRSEETSSQASSETEYATPVVEAAPLTVIVEEKTIEVSEEQSRSPSIIEETLPYSEHELGEERKEDADSASSISEEEIMVVSPHAQKAFEPTTFPAKSIMYADTSSDDDSDEEEEREVLPPVQRSQKIMDFDKISEPTQNGRLESESTLASNTFGDSASEDEEIVENTLKMPKQQTLAVTRIVVRDDGRPDELTSGIMRVNLDGREAITDEEFSEKLI
ncbi:unnamed protein product [Cylicocyclus nassatus]|uniref:Uncharacterized protein n=1 Tax=Cylicocyclus nassatus TaxID=53992 RepID=A0AA36M8F3_CYLNA|nr:unnamed protein product [Cylicocyclus nassatus]